MSAPHKLCSRENLMIIEMRTYKTKPGMRDEFVVSAYFVPALCEEQLPSSQLVDIGN
jgi:hypothetical protein